MLNGGYYTIDQLRLEKGYRAFGRELTPDYDPVEAGLLFTCKLRTDIAFLGREAVEQAQAPRARAAGWSRSWSTSPSRCCGAASWCCATGRVRAR